MSEKSKAFQTPTIGRILHYTYGESDRVEAVARGAVRPAIVSRVGSSESEGICYCDVVVFTAGTNDFLPGREGFAGTLSKLTVPISTEPAPGALHWPART